MHGRRTKERHTSRKDVRYDDLSRLVVRWTINLGLCTGRYSEENVSAWLPRRQDSSTLNDLRILAKDNPHTPITYSRKCLIRIEMIEWCPLSLLGVVVGLIPHIPIPNMTPPCSLRDPH